jgi:hypothetical protein
MTAAMAVPTVLVFGYNFATDLAPLLVLFGKQAPKQVLSEFTSSLDNMIFGISPLGVCVCDFSPGGRRRNLRSHLQTLTNNHGWHLTSTTQLEKSK